MRDYYNRSYGSDYNLLNGRQYNLLYSSVSHPFFNSDRYRPGTLVLNTASYAGIPINYDIYKQQVVLQYTTYTGQPNQLVLNPELLDRFGLDGKEFIKLTFPGTGSSFYQVVRSGEISCYLHWEKKLFQSSTSSNTPYKYTKQFRKVYVVKEGQLFPVGNRASFTGLFDKVHEKEISRYLRREKIRLGKASDQSLGLLMDYCVSLKDRP